VVQHEVLYFSAVGWSSQFLSKTARPAEAHQITSISVTPFVLALALRSRGLTFSIPNSGTVTYEIDTSPKVGTFTGSIAVSERSGISRALAPARKDRGELPGFLRKEEG
jgi:hypothetical protein